MVKIVSVNLSDAVTCNIDEQSNQLINSLSHSDSELSELFTGTTAVFTDADGTIVQEGTTDLSETYYRAITELSSKGVFFTVVTGKPLAEVSRLINSIPFDVPLHFLCEKGAYMVSKSNESFKKIFVLSSEADEVAITELKQTFIEHMPSLQKQFNDDNNQQRVWFGWSGRGEHKSIVSIDIYGVEPPSNYLEIVGPQRDSLKLNDPILLGEVERAIEQFVWQYHPDWHVVHLGNGNTDIAPNGIEKDLAIEQTQQFTSANIVQLWGDTMNDLAMFRLKDKYPNKVIAGLVLHREKGKELLAHVDMTTYGMANSAPYFELLLQTHS